MATETYQHSSLTIGDFPHQSEALPITGTGVVSAGTPIKTTDGLAFAPATLTAEADDVVAVLAETMDFGGGATITGPCHRSGKFDEQHLQFTGTLTSSELNASFRKRAVALFIQTLVA